jgi:hypothetical protein
MEDLCTPQIQFLSIVQSPITSKFIASPPYTGPFGLAWNLDRHPRRHKTLSNLIKPPYSNQKGIWQVPNPFFEWGPEMHDSPFWRS